MRFRVINSKEIYREGRFDGSYHNAEAIIYDNIIKAHSSHNLDYYCTDIFTSGRNKRVYTSKEFGYPFLSNSDAASQNPFSSCKYNSKKYGYDESAVLKAGMILTGRVGAIGQTSFVPKYWEELNAMGSDNIIRIVVKPEYKNGYIYAYLASRIGNLQFWKHATGGVQPFITDAMVGELPIPDFPERFQIKVDDLIKESSNLRDEAANALEKAHKLIEDYFSYFENTSRNSVNVKNIFADNIRFDASYHLSDSINYEKVIESFGYKLLSDLCDDIYGGGRSKRYYTTDRSKGVPYLSNSDLSKANPLRTCKYSLKSKAIDSEMLKEGMIVTGRVGAIGQTQIIGSQFDTMQVMASDNVIRIIPKKDNGYIYAFLSSHIGRVLFWKYATGGVQPFISSSMVGKIKIPLLSRKVIEECNQLIESYSIKIEESNLKEDMAILMVESEIEKWNN